MKVMFYGLGTILYILHMWLHQMIRIDDIFTEPDSDLIK